MKRGVIGSLLGALLSNPVAMGIAVVALVAIAAAWFYSQAKETKESEELRESQRDKDSIWNQ